MFNQMDEIREEVEQLCRLSPLPLPANLVLCTDDATESEVTSRLAAHVARLNIKASE